MKYSIILEPTTTGFSAYCPDIDGCIATGQTEEETRINLQEAIEFHFEGLKLKHIPIPKCHTISSYVEISEYSF